MGVGDGLMRSPAARAAVTEEWERCCRGRGGARIEKNSLKYF